MKKNTMHHPWYQRLLAFGIAVLMAFGAVPLNTRAEVTTQAYTEDLIDTVADDQTLGRPNSVYGTDTKNAGKITVGKSVHNGVVSINYGNNKTQTFTPDPNNFIVTSSQASQVVSLVSESTAPVDVVFVLDTSGSMSGRVTQMVNAANDAIRTLLQANENNRVSVVAFSGTQGGGTSAGAAANVLTPLGHYNGDGETSHLTYTGGMIYGRGTTGSERWSRRATSTGTNIHAGVVVGAKQLMNATDITIQSNGKSITRIPFLVIMSDGQPSYAASGTWYDPTLTSQLGNLTNLAGLGFLPALAAAYYKGAITDKYFNTNASDSNRCFIYTMGLGLTSLSSDQQNLALMTVDPKNATTSNTYYNTFNTYWNNYVTGEAFDVRVSGSNPRDYRITKDSITFTKNYVNGQRADGTSMGYTGGYKYNDKYFSATQASDLAGAFDDVVISIQQQAMSSPTRVEDAHGAGFSGYVTYTDPIGEYMEVKQVFGVLADGNYYQGKTFAQNMQNWSTSTSQEFKDHFLKVLKERCKVTGASLTDAQLLAIIEKAVASDNQLYYDPNTGDYDNSFAWFGKSYKEAGEEDLQMQILDFAEDDSIEYITDSNTTIPAGADYVCRSYYYYGTAGNTVTNPNNEYLHFVVRVQRSLKAPYQQTVVISAPASLLSMEKVVINEKDVNGNKTYTATVTEADPARVVYEVGLRSDINAFNVEEILKKDAEAAVNAYDYTAETTVSNNQTINPNYDAATGTYHFYTNDWDRTQSADADIHHRAMTHATFDAAADNAFYTYTKDTPIYKKNGDTYTLYNGTETPVGEYYYLREYYDWTDATATNNTYNATKKTAYIRVDIPAGITAVKRGTDSWYVEKGAYKASSLSSVVEDVPKEPNRTGTAAIVVHPHRTENFDNSHYTVLLGNNGKLSLKRADTKRVDITKPDRTDYNGTTVTGTTIQNADGKVVMVGDVLTYTVKIINGGTTEASAVATDKIPVGTVYVANSASEGGVYGSATNTITWNIDKIPAGHFVEVSFKVQVTEAALTGDLDVVTIDNQAHVKLSNNFEYNTNTTSNPPEGKKVVDTNGNSFVDSNGNPLSVEVPNMLVYRIRWHNDSDSVADVTVTDKIPAGTTYHEDSSSPAATKVENGVITWVIEDVQPGTSGVVSFRVNVNAGLPTDQNGKHYVENNATITVNNDYRITNRPRVMVDTGGLTLSKTVTGYPAGAAEKTFVLHLHEIGDDLDGVYAMEKNGTAVSGGITFRAGHATVEIQNGDTLKILDIPAGAIISVTEAPMSGFTPAYSVNGGAASAAEGRVAIVKDTAVSVAVANTYSPNPARLQLSANKILSTDVSFANTTFGFTAYPCDAAGQAIAGKDPLTGEVTVSSDNKTAQVVFGMENYTAAGDYYYLVSEINGGVTGVTYSQAQYLVHVVVTDDGSGVLSAAVADVGVKNGSSFDAVANEQISFTNAYAPLDTQVILEADKELSGRDLQPNEFSFVVKEGTTEVSYGTNDADGNVLFRPITYTAAELGTHTYTISEIDGGLKGVTYSNASFTVTVEVKDVNGKLVAIPNYPTSGVVFENTFTPDDVSVTWTGTKNLTGRDMVQDEFDFVVTETVDGTVKTVATGTNTATGSIIFTSIGYTVADVGEHIYTVSEVKPDLAADPNMYYDPQTYQVKVVVSYDSSTGILSASDPEILNASAIVFDNIQNPAYVDVEIAGTKVTNNAPATGDLSFSFSVVDMDGNLASGGSAPANGAISFTNLSYTEPGIHYYWIYESNHAGDTAHGVTYSGARYLLKVEVTRNAVNRLVATTTYYPAGTVADTGKTYADHITGTPIPDPATGVVFTNTYAAKGTATVTATKTLEDKTLIAGDFLFKLERVDVNDNNNVLSTMYAANDDAGAIVFPSIIVDNTALPSNGTAEYFYVMSEVVTDANRLPGVTYSDAVYYLKVTFTDDGAGNINHVIKYYTDGTYTEETTSQSAVFANSYAPAEGTTATIEATKTLSGRPLKAGEFGFELYHVTASGENLVATTTNAADGKISFTRNYPATLATGDYKYVLREINSGLGGVTYSGAQYWIVVTVTDNKTTGKLENSVAYYADEACTQLITKEQAIFTNRYEAQSTTYTPVATKVLNNRNLDDREFAFVVKDSNDNTVSTGLNNANGTVTFTPIGYNAATAPNAPHVYTIHEVVGNLTGVTYSDAVYYLQVTVTDNGDGTMTASGKYFTDAACTNEVSTITFTNTYTPQSISVQLQAKKIMVDHAMRDGSFSFLVRDLSDPSKPIVATGGNLAAAPGVEADIVFSNIGYTYAMLGTKNSRTFIYEIKEQNTTHGGVTIHEGSYYAKVVLSYNAETGMLSTQTDYFLDKDCTQEITTALPVFTNVYDPADATLVIPMDKTLVNKVLEADEFLFTLKNEAGAVVDTATNDASGHAAFDQLTFDKEGTYTYFVSEAVNTAAGFVESNYTLDNTVKVVVTVTDDERGQLHTAAQYYAVDAAGNAGTEELGGVEFINHYTAPELTVPLNTEINATKTVKTPAGVTYSAAGFKFAVTDVTGAVIKGWENGVEVNMIGTSGTDGKITFPEFKFPKAGEYHYWINELPSGVEGMTDDLRTWEVHILVRYNDQTGLLYVQDSDVKTYLVGNAASESADPDFVNAFDPAPVSITLTVDKVLEGRDLLDREFQFYLMEGDIIVAQGHNDVNGKVKFNLTYTAANIGTHSYTVKEVVPENANNGITYDTASKTVPTISVSYDTADSKLVASVGGTPVANGAVVVSGAAFSNKYTTQDVTAQINAHKVITANRVLKDQEFTFVLIDSEDKVVETAKNDAAGWITFQLDYDEAGIYEYKVLELPGTDSSLRYDTNRYKVTVTVTDDLLGQLHAVVEYEDGVVPTFVNEYKALSTTATVEAKKTLTGNKTLAAGDFTFELESEDGVKVTTKNLADGVVKFGLRYDAAGVYTYTLREKAGDAAGVTYDDTEYTVVVTVIDNLEGSLVATVAYEGLAEGENLPTFVNTYKGKAAPVQITAAKKLSGKTLTADAFSFTLTNKDNVKDVYTVKNDAQGNVVFNLSLTEVGTYTYILAEATGTDANITYDKNTYTVTVKVTDDLQGNLKAEVTYDTTDGKAPTFENVHTPSAITVELTGKKTLKGRDLKADEFSFQITNGSGNVVATAKNDAKGELKFSGITLTEAGKYTFAVTEVKGSVKGMIYDDAKYIVTVEVVNENGVLKATVTEPEGGLVFQNTYKDPDPTNPGTGDDTPLLLLVGLMVVSGGAVVALLADRKKRRA